jgi:hypothetical protein
MPNDQLELELLSNAVLEPLAPPSLDAGVSWGLMIRIRWHRAQGGWCVCVANIDSTDSVKQGWVPNGQAPAYQMIPLNEYLKKLERLFGIS